MNMEGPGFSVFESADTKLKNEINTKLSELLKRGTPLADIVELLDANEFLEYIEPRKKQSLVAHFDVDGFIKKRTSENRKFSLPEEYIKIDETILPPSEMEIKSGNGTSFKEAGIIPRSTMLMETLTEMGLKYSVVEGKNDPKMVRKLSYLIFNLPSIKKLVLVNDEERNATFIIHKAEKEEWKKYIKIKKEELSKMSYEIISSINYSDRNKEGHGERWKDRIKNLLMNGPQQPDITSEIQEIQEGWKSSNASRKILGFSWPIFQKYVDVYKKINPEWIIHRGRRGTYISPELINILKKNRMESAVPEGWLSPFALAKKLDIRCDVIQNLSKKYRQTNPEWFRIYTNIQGKEIEHYSPELVDMIRKKSADFISAPENWIMLNALSKKIGIHPDTLKKYIENYRTIHPDYFRYYYKTKGGVLREHYSPELTDILINKYGNIEPVPKDWSTAVESVPKNWLTASKLGPILNANALTVKKIAENYRSDHPEWFKVYRNQSRTAEHFHPDLINLIRKEFEGSRAMPGWLGPYMFAKKIDADGKTIKKQAEIYRTNHPDWFKNYKDQWGRIREQYSPELVSIIENELKKPAIPIEQAPDGWLTEYSTTKSMKITWETIKKIVNSYRINHPDWFKIYKDRRGTPREHYSPELIEKIQEDKEKDFAPAGWVSAYHLSKSIGIAVTTVQYYADEYRAQHPEWFKDYLHEKRRRLIKYFSPELSKILSDKYGKIELAPKDWLIAKTLGKSIGVDKITVKKHAEKYRTEHPEWFKNYRHPRGLQLEYYSPELAEILKKELSKDRDNKN